jgi:hypothetical protein
MGEIAGKINTAIIKQTDDGQIRSKLRLGEVERLIKKHRIVVPCLSRQTLQNMCEDGTFETAGDRPTRLGWLVYEDSFWKWAKDAGNDL